MDLSLVDTDLVGACGLGDPRLPIFDDQVVCAAGHAVYSEFLIFCEIEGFDYFSIAGNFNDYPYELRTYARQQIIRESYITERSLVTSCQLINTVRSDNNPQGFIIERFMVLENKDLGRYER